MLEPMSEDRFWALIASTTAPAHEPEEHLSALRAALEVLSAADIEAFEAAFGEQMRRSYSWDLWGAAYVVHGGASDDGFEYFRRWLISRGREAFAKVLADPDSLGELVDPDAQDALELEELAYVAAEVLSAKVGEPRDPALTGGQGVDSVEPAGTPLEEDDAILAGRYPRLWQRFGRAPLG